LKQQFEGSIQARSPNYPMVQRKWQECELLTKGPVDAVVTNRIKTAVVSLEQTKVALEQQLHRANERLPKIEINGRR